MTSTAFPKVDFRTERKDLYAPGRDFGVVEVPSFDFLKIDGSGDPNTSPEYAAAVEALYTLSYALKFASKAQLARDYVVAPLEGLWWGGSEFAALAKDEWSWTMMIRQPDWLTDSVWDAARGKVEKKPLPALDAVRHERLDEGTSVQFMHIGSYDDEAPMIARMHEWIAANESAETGWHHEIYISDPRRTAVEKLKTVVRQPIQRL